MFLATKCAMKSTSVRFHTSAQRWRRSLGISRKTKVCRRSLKSLMHSTWKRLRWRNNNSSHGLKTISNYCTRFCLQIQKTSTNTQRLSNMQLRLSRTSLNALSPSCSSQVYLVIWMQVSRSLTWRSRKTSIKLKHNSITFLYFINGLKEEYEYVGKIFPVFPQMPSQNVAGMILSYFNEQEVVIALMNRLCSNTRNFACSNAHKEILTTYLRRQTARKLTFCGTLKFLFTGKPEMQPDTRWPETQTDILKLTSGKRVKLSKINFIRE